MKMTVYSAMDLLNPDVETDNGIETTGSADNILNSDSEDKQDNSIATLDVTSEEIVICHKCWKHSSEHCTIDKCKHELNSSEVTRPRSETWPYNINENIANIEFSNTFHSDYSLYKPNSLQEAPKFNGVSPSIKAFNGKNCRPSGQSAEVKDQSSCSLDKDKTNLSANLTDSQNTTVSDTVLSGDLQDLHLNSNEDVPSGFTDISLQSNSTADETDGVPGPTHSDDLSLNSAKMSGRPSLGSLFGWVSASKEEKNINHLVQNNQRKDIVDKTAENQTAHSSIEATNKEQTKETKVQKNVSTSAVDQKNSGIRNIGKSIKSSLSNKSWFWKNHNVEPLSTTALILENRPSNLPSKSPEEAERHRQEYEKMVQIAKKNELRDVYKKKKDLRKQLKEEDNITSTSTIWTTEILPNWSAMHNTNRTRQMWWSGLPPSVRGKVWQLAIGNELNITQDLYEIMVTRAHDKLRSMHDSQSMGEETESLASDRESTVELIRLDISRTFPHLGIFQKGGPYYDILHDVLGAYASYRPDVGYVQGMSFVAAMLLLNLDPAPAFITFANLLNKPCQVAFFRINKELMNTYYATFEVFFEENLPKLFAHFKHNNLSPDIYLLEWIFTMFSKALSLDSASRVWDLYCRDGEEFLFKIAIAILKIHESSLLQMEVFNAAQFLTRLPPDSFTHQQLFRHASDVIMVSRGNRRWKDVLSLMKDVS